VLREAGTKAAAEHRQFEAALKARCKEFDKRVEQYAAELAVVEGRNDIVKREVVASEVRHGCGVRCGADGMQLCVVEERSGQVLDLPQQLSSDVAGVVCCAMSSMQLSWQWCKARMTLSSENLWRQR
jgi:hypothetical protein